MRCDRSRTLGWRWEKINVILTDRFERGSYYLLLSKTPDNLVPFLETVASNQKANILAHPQWYDLMRRVNICLATAGQNMVNPKPVMCGVLFLRCQYAYKTAAALSLAGQVSEAFVQMRSCLEYAG